MNDILEGLNPEQIEAVKTTSGPVLILAGAGSGKTKTLIHRTAYLIKKEGVLPHNLLIVTFTNKAAGELRERLDKMLGRSIHILWLGTFHSICVKILRRDGESVGAKQNFAIFDEADQKQVVKKAMEKIGIDSKEYAPEGILSFISSAKNEMISPIDYPQYVNSQFQEIVAKIYPLYQNLLSDANALDFDDLLIKAVELFQKNPETLKKYQKIFQYIQIDEYQDTNKVQYKLIELLAKAHNNICVVGDDWQSIYAFRGADFRNILNFKKDYPEAKIIKLEQNYRSTKNILAAAQSVIEKNQHRSDKALWTDNAKGEKIILYPAYNEKDEAEFVIREIIDQSGKNLSLADFVVLYRTNAQSRALEEIFLKYGVPYQIIGGLKFYERREIKDMIAYLRFAQNPYDIFALERIINTPPRGIGDSSKNQIIKNWQSHILTFKNVDDLDISKTAKNGLENFLKLQEDIQREAKKLPLDRLIDYISSRSGYLEYARNNFSSKTPLMKDNIEGESRAENIKELKSVAAGFIADDPQKALANFLEEVALISDIDEYSDSEKKVSLMTMHNAKGLEFPIVFIAGMEENLFPHSRSSTDTIELEEERRLCYVGMTRAREKLYLIYAQTRMLYGGFQTNLPSRFLSEIPDEYLLPWRKRYLEYGLEYKKPTLDIKVSESYKEGDKIIHEIFGKGIVVEAKDEILTIAFIEGGIKKLDPQIAKLKKI